MHHGEPITRYTQSVCVYIDDVLVRGTTEQDHLANLTEVLRRMSVTAVQLKGEKCAFMLSQVHYLGHTVSSEGIQPTADKICAIRDDAAPTNLNQLKSFLGLINFYTKFLPNLSTILAPPYSLLQKNRPWPWGPPQCKAFHLAKPTHCPH